LSFSFKNGQSYKLFSICCTSVEVCTVAVRIADNVLRLGGVPKLSTLNAKTEEIINLI